MIGNVIRYFREALASEKVSKKKRIYDDIMAAVFADRWMDSKTALVFISIFSGFFTVVYIESLVRHFGLEDDFVFI